MMPQNTSEVSIILQKFESQKLAKILGNLFKSNLAQSSWLGIALKAHLTQRQAFEAILRIRYPKLLLCVWA